MFYVSLRSIDTHTRGVGGCDVEGLPKIIADHVPVRPAYSESIIGPIAAGLPIDKGAFLAYA